MVNELEKKNTQQETDTAGEEPYKVKMQLAMLAAVKIPAASPTIRLGHVTHSSVPIGICTSIDLCNHSKRFHPPEGSQMRLSS